MKVAILGVGSLAIALSKVFARNTKDIVMWGKFKDECEQLELNRENIKVFPDVKIPQSVIVTNNLQEAIVDADIIVNVLPFVAVREIAMQMKDIYSNDQVICSTTKGIDEGKFIPCTSIFEEVLGTTNIVAISGPSFAKEIADEQDISFMLGGVCKEAIETTKSIFSGNNIKLEVTDDILGIQIAGGVKNAIALGAGMLAGLNAAESTRAAYLALGLNDMSKMITLLGGNKETAYSYAGVGDLILTCMSHTSRNFSFGYLLGQGNTVEQAFEKMGAKTVEGYKVIKAIYNYSKEKGVDLDIIDTLYDIIFNAKDITMLKKV